MRTWLVLGLVVIASAISAAAVHDHVPEGVFLVLNGLVPVGAGLAVNIITTRRRRARRADQPDSIERDQERFAAVHTLPITIVSLAVVGTWLIVNDWFAPGALVYGTLVLTLATFWIQYARAPRHL
ncbi:hypothetical protein [Sanguibacter suaedae]|uniref:SdpI family protein n=1 Tax=Sanguibacter suaedae TaxID=2795737 RepID=A0A934IBJ8_9MICO|nr:hypothetical protein [Sanguibacter suaedae]MBI9115670.1 hypothetical protein [Sanguibacter suaedae]